MKKVEQIQAFVNLPLNLKFLTGVRIFKEKKQRSKKAVTKGETISVL
jgi:hypothetical protein